MGMRTRGVPDEGGRERLGAERHQVLDVRVREADWYTVFAKTPAIPPAGLSRLGDRLHCGKGLGRGRGGAYGPQNGRARRGHGRAGAERCPRPGRERHR